MDKDSKKILTDYFQGKTSGKVTEKAKKFIIDHRNDDALNDLLAEEWNETSSDNQFHINSEEYWNEISRHVDESSKSGVLSIFSKTTIGISVAAAVTLAILTFIFIGEFQVQDSIAQVAHEVTYTDKQTNKGEKLNVALPDGSNIRLNSSSKIRIPSNYSSAKERVVFLEGEAFFKVSKFEGKTFKVISKGVTTEVLGTSFNINSKDKEDNVSVAVVTGKVQVSTKRSRIVLNPNEITSVRAETINLKKSWFDQDEVTGWNDNVLVFREESFVEVIDQLEEWYGVEFIIKGQPKVASKYNGRFENTSLQVVLEGLGFSSSFDYKIKNKTIFLKF
jgi:transmembrane sensor